MVMVAVAVAVAVMMTSLELFNGALLTGEVM
jgi:hypothetical protein